MKNTHTQSDLMTMALHKTIESGLTLTTLDDARSSFQEEITSSLKQLGFRKITCSVGVLRCVDERFITFTLDATNEKTGDSCSVLVRVTDESGQVFVPELTWIVTEFEDSQVGIVPFIGRQLTRDERVFVESQLPPDFIHITQSN